MTDFCSENIGLLTFYLGLFNIFVSSDVEPIIIQPSFHYEF